MLYIDEVEAFFINIGNKIEKLQQAAGIAITQEWLMRVIGEHCNQVHNKLNTIAKRGSKNYLNCKLEYLELAIIEVFGEILTQEDNNHIEKFRKARNKLVHAELVSFMELMSIEPIGRQIIAGKRVLLKSDDIKEAFMSSNLQNAYQQFNILSMDYIQFILKKIIKKCLAHHKECFDINRKLN